jgi:arylsulfatase I/J
MGWNNGQPGAGMGDTPFMDGMVKSGLRLDQHYAFRFCSPTRSALLTGRLPIHVNQKNSAVWGWTAAAVHPKFTMLPAKLASAGYISHQIGKVRLHLSRPVFGWKTESAQPCPRVDASLH